MLYDRVGELGGQVTRYTTNGTAALTETKTIQKEWARYDPGVEMIVAGYDENGKVLMYVIQNPHGNGSWVEPYAFPGNATIGSGSYNADFWLDYRQQHLGMSAKRSVYHAYEASRMASKSPTVNEDIEMLLAMPDAIIYASSKEPPTDDALLVIAKLESLFKKRGPRHTKDLDIFMPSVSQTTAAQP